MGIYAGYNKNIETRLNSSSGGIFTALAKRVIMDNGIVYGAMLNERLSAEYYAADSLEKLEGLRKSKYIQSNISQEILNSVQGELQNRSKVLFCGLPCHVEAVKRHIKSDYDQLYTIDFVCHGVPYQKAWDRYVAFQESLHRSKIKAVDFRNKKESWRKYSIKLEFENGDIYCRQYMEDPYMQAFLYDLILRPGCYYCKCKGIERNSDITIGDFWGIENIFPEIDDDKGTSVIITHSKKGEMLLHSVMDELNTIPVLDDRFITYNPSIINSAVKHSQYEYFQRKLDSKRFDRLVKECLFPSWYSRLFHK